MLLWNTLIYSVGVSVIAISFGLLLSFITTRTDTPGRGLLYYLPFLPLAFPVFLMNLGWIYLFGQNTGLANSLLKSLVGWTPFDIYTLGGMIWATGVAQIPISYLAIAPAMSSMNPVLDDASRISGGGVLFTARRITIPLLLPAIVSAFVLDLALAVESFEAPVMIGWPAGVDVLMSRIYLNTQNLVPPDYTTSSAYAMLTLAITMSLFLVYNRLFRSAKSYQVVTGRGYSHRSVSLGRWKYVFLATVCIYLVVVVLLPLAMLVILSLERQWNAYSPLSDLSLDNYQFLFSGYSGALGSLANSIPTWVLTATIVTVAAFLIAYTVYMTNVRGRGLLEGISVLPIAVPSLLIGFGFLWSFLTIRSGLWGTIGVLIIALVVTLLPQAIRALSGPILQIHSEQIEASRIAGASTIPTIRRVLLPLLRNSLIGTWLYVLIVASKAVGPLILLMTSQNQVLSTYIWNDWISKPADTGVVAAAGILLMAIAWVCILVLLLFQRRLSDAILVR